MLFSTMRAYVIISTFILMSCNDTKVSTETEVTNVSQLDTLISQESEKAINQNAQKFPTADTMMHSFFSDINKASNYIDPKQGVYCLESGPGASPLMEKLMSQEDLMGKTPFLFLCRDHEFIKNQVYVNPQDYDFCNDFSEGYFIFDLKEQQTVLEDAYNIIIAQEGTTANDALLLNYKTIDKSLSKSIVVSFENKHGDATILKFYFTIKEGKMVLSILDIRECGV